MLKKQVEFALKWKYRYANPYGALSRWRDEKTLGSVTCGSESGGATSFLWTLEAAITLGDGGKTWKKNCQIMISMSP